MRRAFAVLLLVSLGFLVGCSGSSSSGTPANNGYGNSPGSGLGPPGPPTPPPGQVQVTTVSPASVAAGGPSFTLTVNGLNFLPSTTVMWNDGFPLTTTYVSSTLLKAEVPASLIARPDSVTIAPSPVGTLNWVGTFTITAAPIKGNNSFSVSSIPVQANDIAWDSVDQQFYLSVAGANGSNANTITTLNPQTGALGLSVSTGSEPGALAVSTDGAYIYAGLNSTSSVQRYTLPALQSDINISLGSGPYGPYHAIDLAAQPGGPHSIAVLRNNQGGVLIYKDTVALPQYVSGSGHGPIDTLLWNPNGQKLYGLDNESGTGLYIMPVTSSGVQLQTTVSGRFGKRLHFDSTMGYIYTDSGSILDPETGAAIGSFPVNAINIGFSVESIMVPDSTLNIAYFLGTIVDKSSYTYVIEAFDLTSFRLLGSIPIANVNGTPSKIIRWGSNGLAILTTPRSADEGSGVYLVSGAFVTSPAP